MVSNACSTILHDNRVMSSVLACFHLQGMDDTRNVAQYGQEDVDEEVLHGEPCQIGGSSAVGVCGFLQHYIHARGRHQGVEVRQRG